MPGVVKEMIYVAPEDIREGDIVMPPESGEGLYADWTKKIQQSQHELELHGPSERRTTFIARPIGGGLGGYFERISLRFVAPENVHGMDFVLPPEKGRAFFQHWATALNENRQRYMNNCPTETRTAFIARPVVD